MAQALDAPLDVIVVLKLGVPFRCDGKGPKSLPGAPKSADADSLTKGVVNARMQRVRDHIARSPWTLPVMSTTGRQRRTTDGRADATQAARVGAAAQPTMGSPRKRRLSNIKLLPGS
ncbi:MAG: hypothetical protein ACSLFB_14130 [Acidimicrobiales bacterium]